MANLEIKVRVTDSELFMKLIALLNDVSTNKEISKEIRDEISEKVNKIVTEVSEK
jgi:GMP synthase PP-ATPase subunit